MKEVGALLDDSVSENARTEAAELLKKKDLTPEDTQRLFELYLQREDTANFLHDFDELKTMFGDANEKDNFDWSEFRLEIEDDLARLEKDLKVADNPKLYGAKEPKSEKNTTPKDANGFSEDGKIVTVTDPTGKEVDVNLEDPVNLVDKDGNLWCGVILNSDTTQTTVPQERVLSHRALVCVGNMRGSCGYGMGKGKNAGDATNAAFR